MKTDVMKSLRQAREEGLAALDEPTGKKILAAAGIRVPNSLIVNAGGDMRTAAAGLKAPYVLKVVATGVVHKSDVGGVRLNLLDADALVAAELEVRTVLRAQGIEPQSWLVEEMAPHGVEVVIGGTMDPEFGPMVMVGLGGIFVEVLKDVSFRICPIRERDAREMIDELTGAPLLRGARGSEPVSIDAIVQVLLCLGGEGGLLLAGERELAEVDINPLIVSSEGAVAVDARFILRQPE
jgi:acyl-CoA synthetase (NDP forming)